MSESKSLFRLAVTLCVWAHLPLRFLYSSHFVIDLLKSPHLYKSCWLGRICSSLLVFFSLKVRTAGEGLVVNTLMMPMGNDSVTSPMIFTMHLSSTVYFFDIRGIRQQAKQWQRQVKQISCDLIRKAGRSYRFVAASLLSSVSFLDGDRDEAAAAIHQAYALFFLPIATTACPELFFWLALWLFWTNTTIELYSLRFSFP